jgi:hypothetical protein
MSLSLPVESLAQRERKTSLQTAAREKDIAPDKSTAPATPPGETSALCLIWAVLELASHRWRGITMTPKGVAEIERLRRALAAGEPFPGLRGEARAA